MIGIFDSGFGGLTILNKIRQALPDYDYIYLGDNANAPYGEKKRQEIYTHTLAGVEWLFDQGCKLVILACNTASAAALHQIQLGLPRKHPGKRVLGIIIPTSESVANRTKNGQIGILATDATVSTRAFTLELLKINPELNISESSGGRLAQMIEHGIIEGDELENEIEARLAMLLRSNPTIDTLVLGCTHYPLIETRIKNYLPKKIAVISQGDIVAEKLADYLVRHSDFESKLSKAGEVNLYTTEDSANVHFLMNKYLAESRIID
jgi:glutamate racemase